MIHKLKCWPAQFEAVLTGRKFHELRRNDRGFHEGDTLMLREWDPTTKEFSERWIIVNVTYLTEGGSFGLANNLVVMSFKVSNDSVACPINRATMEVILGVSTREDFGEVEGPLAPAPIIGIE